MNFPLKSSEYADTFIFPLFSIICLNGNSGVNSSWYKHSWCKQLFIFTCHSLDTKVTVCCFGLCEFFVHLGNNISLGKFCVNLAKKMMISFLPG